jgi:hypothetical protein
MITKEQLEQWLGPRIFQDMIWRIIADEEISKAAIKLAETILERTPNCADQIVAIRKLRECKLMTTEALKYEPGAESLCFRCVVINDILTFYVSHPFISDNVNYSIPYQKFVGSGKKPSKFMASWLARITARVHADKKEVTDKFKRFISENEDLLELEAKGN